MIRKISACILALILISGCTAPQSIPLPAALAPTETSVFIEATVFYSTPSPTPPPPVAEGDDDDCDAPFYPVSDGAAWEYAISSGGSAAHSMSVDENNAFVTTIQGGDSLFTVTGRCTSEGIVLLDVPGISTSYQGAEGSSALSTNQTSGLTLPSDVSIGETWSQIIQVQLSTGDDATIESNYEALGFENITVPAGNFYALKVEQSGSVKMMGHNIKMHGYHWYAEGVGVVRSAMDGAPFAELVSYDIPD